MADQSKWRINKSNHPGGRFSPYLAPALSPKKKITGALTTETKKRLKKNKTCDNENDHDDDSLHHCPFGCVFERIKSVFTLQDDGAFVFLLLLIYYTREGIGRKGKMGGTVCWMNNYLNYSCFCNVFYFST